MVTAELGEGAVQRPLLARLAGDEFTIFFPSVEEPGDAERVARRIALAISEPFELHARHRPELLVCNWEHQPADDKCKGDNGQAEIAQDMAQAIIFLILLGVVVDPILLTGSVIALLMGGVLGAPLAVRARVWVVQSVVSIALVIAAALYAMTNLGLMPGGGTASSLPLTLTVVAIVANFVFGALLNFGIGNYAPTLVMVPRSTARSMRSKARSARSTASSNGLVLMVAKA